MLTVELSRGLAFLLFILVMAAAPCLSATGAVQPSRALDFFSVLGNLKTLKRTGWVNHEIPLPESVADHMYRMSMLSFMITDKQVNRDELIKICLVHDLAEAKVGDITPYDGVSKEEKRRLEETALRQILADIGQAAISEELLSLWMAYEEGNSHTANVAKQLDKFEMIVQADEYEAANPGKRLDSFFASTVGYFTHPEIASWDAALRTKRDLRWGSVGAEKNSDWEL